MSGEVFCLKPTTWSGGIYARRDALLRVPILQMARLLHIGDAQKRIPPSEVGHASEESAPCNVFRLYKTEGRKLQNACHPDDTHFRDRFRIQ